MLRSLDPEGKPEAGVPGSPLVRARLWLVLAVLALPQAVLAQAPQQEACRPPFLAFEEPRASFEPGSTTSVLWSVQNTNVAPVESVRATVTTTVPPGWSAVAAQREFTLGPETELTSALAITAPNRGSGASAGNVTVLVSFVCTSGDIQTSASATHVLPVTLRAFEAPWPLVLGAFAVLAGGVTILGLRRLQRGTALVAWDVDRTIEPGHSVKYTFAAENRRGKPQRLRLVAEGVPEGWTLHLALKDVELEPGEEKTLWAILKAPPLATVGTEVTITLRLVGERGAETASATLHARVGGP